jgi:ribosome biogenesis GTPase / thiamine phosphate phosphatase
VYRVAPDRPEAARATTLLEASLRGRLRQRSEASSPPVAGDLVELVQDASEAWTVERVLPRSSELVRGGMRGRFRKVLAANVDQAIVVVAAGRPPVTEDGLDRFLVLAELSGVAPVVVLNKMDLPGAEEVLGRLTDHLRGTAYPLLPLSHETLLGIPELRDALTGKASVLMGPSGVGKSSLLNLLAPEAALRTGAVSARQGRGRHTTVSARLLPLPAGTGWVVDTPGFSDVTAWRPDTDALGEAFPEIRARQAECRFRGCSHIHEPGCAVREAFAQGEWAVSRLRSYERLMAGE